MEYLFIVLLALGYHQPIAPNTSVKETVKPSPLAAYSSEWNKQVYSPCNTAEKEDYMNDKEKEVIYILNLARSYPKLFATTVLTKYLSRSGKERLLNDQYYQSLTKKMLTMDPVKPLAPNKKCYLSAACHASTSGKSGYTGHTRVSAECKAQKYFFGECCDYGNTEPIDIILTLLIDENVSSLGHRKILLGNYSSIGVSIQPHKTYKQNTVLDLYI